MDKYELSMINSRSRAAGKQFENIITGACRHYNDKGYARISKTPEPFHITRNLRNGKMEGYFEEKAEPDYKGVLRDGRAVMFDAKHTDKDRIYQTAISERQKTELDIYESYGAVCFVAVSIQFERFYRIPWETWKSMKGLFGHKYMNLEELEPYKVKAYRGTPLILDGLELIN